MTSSHRSFHTLVRSPNLIYSHASIVPSLIINVPRLITVMGDLHCGSATLRGEDLVAMRCGLLVTSMGATEGWDILRGPLPALFGDWN